MSLLDRFGTPYRVLAKELSAFGVVGVINLFIDIGLFNLLHFQAGLGPTTSNILSTGVATTISYFGNRHWSFSHRARTGLRREYTLFFLINLVALGIGSLVIAFTYYVIGTHDPFALNVAKVVGIGIGTVLRFWSYKRWVFPAHKPEPGEGGATSADVLAEEADGADGQDAQDRTVPADPSSASGR